MAKWNNNRTLLEEQQKRWISSNAALASLLAAGLFAIALMGVSGIKYEAAIGSRVSTAGTFQPDLSSDGEMTGSIPAKAKAGE